MTETLLAIDGLTQLELLKIGNAQLGPLGAARLKQRLPNCVIETYTVSFP